MGDVVQFPGRYVGPERWVTKREFAKVRKRSTRWVEQQVARGLPSQMRGHKRMFPLDRAQRWLDGEPIEELPETPDPEGEGDDNLGAGPLPDAS